jgi:predicted nucleic-acid-binding Zn-ribbon protein
MRKTGICPKCQHDHTLLVDRIADSGYTEIRNMHLAVVFQGTGFFGDEKLERAGKLSAVVCRACGFTELYVKDPECIPVDGKFIVERGPAPSTGPHR